MNPCLIWGLQEWLDHAQLGCFLPVADRQEEVLVRGDQWKTSTPERQDDKMVDFDGSRVQAWLRVQSATLPERSTSCSKAVQTDEELKVLFFFLNYYLELNITQEMNQTN